MPVMQVRIVRMAVRHTRMPVNMRMRLTSRVVGPMCVTMVLVMHMAVLMHHLFVFMLMLVVFNQMEPKAEAHQHGGNDQARRDGLAEQHQGKHRTNEGGRREISSGSRRPQMA